MNMEPSQTPLNEIGREAFLRSHKVDSVAAHCVNSFKTRQASCQD
jgi:hypothetical protein